MNLILTTSRPPPPCPPFRSGHGSGFPAALNMLPAKPAPGQRKQCRCCGKTPAPDALPGSGPRPFHGVPPDVPALHSAKGHRRVGVKMEMAASSVPSRKVPGSCSPRAPASAQPIPRPAGSTSPSMTRFAASACTASAAPPCANPVTVPSANRRRPPRCHRTPERTLRTLWWPQPWLIEAICSRLPQVSEKTAVVTGPICAGGWVNSTPRASIRSYSSATSSTAKEL